MIPVFKAAGLLTAFLTVSHAADLYNAMSRQHFREKRSQYPLTMGHTIFDVKCADSPAHTVCSPGGAQDCPHGYNAMENIGSCGFATLSHFIESRNIAGTCCIKVPGDTTPTDPGVDPENPVTTTPKGPKIVVYAVPVYAGYPNPPYGGSGSGYGGPGGRISPIYKVEAEQGSLGRRSSNPGKDLLENGVPTFTVKEVDTNNGPHFRNQPLQAPQNQPLQGGPSMSMSDYMPPVPRQEELAGYTGENDPKFYPYPALPKPVDVNP